VALSDSSGDTVQTYEYSVYGQVAVEDPNHPNPYMFAGRRFDIEIGLYYNRARYYSPFTGRFLQTDPIGYGAGMNLYAYCKNNACNLKDPMGLDPILDHEGRDSGEFNEKDDPFAIFLHTLALQYVFGNGAGLRYTNSSGVVEGSEQARTDVRTLLFDWASILYAEVVANEKPTSDVSSEFFKGDGLVNLGVISGLEWVNGPLVRTYINEFDGMYVNCELTIMEDDLVWFGVQPILMDYMDLHADKGDSMLIAFEAAINAVMGLLPGDHQAQPYHLEIDCGWQTMVFRVAEDGSLVMAENSWLYGDICPRHKVPKGTCPVDH